MTTLRILHFNDVYRVQPFKLRASAPETIDVTQFAHMLDTLRQAWPDREDGKKDGLVLFSGDVFSPSVESSVTRGSHMVPVMNQLAPDVSLTGNHDFDFGYPHLSKLIEGTKFPWLLSNIIDSQTSAVPKGLYEFQVFERSGLKIGVIGLVEPEWLGTVSSWPPNFKYKDMAEIGKKLSQRLRDPQGEHKCDLVIALTHSRVPNDITLAKKLFALSPSAQDKSSIANEHGVDLILGGHDHLYYVSRGVSGWENFDLEQKILGAEQDKGDILVIKSGTDFRDLSQFELELENTPEGSVRRKVIKTIKGIHHETKPDSPSSQPLAALLKDILSSVSSSLGAPVCKTSVELDVRSQNIRVAESAAGNWFADIVQHAYDKALCVKGYGGTELVFICAGMLRGDSTYGPGDITLGNILEILPFEDPLVVLEVDGKTIWDALEASLETWPAQEGRFPVISGFRVSWDSSKKPRERVLGVWLLKEQPDGEGECIEEPIERTADGRKYVLLTREYMAQGHDGFVALKGHKYLVDDESGQMMSAIVRKYLLGSLYVHQMARKSSLSNTGTLDSETLRIITHERERQQKHRPSLPASQWRLAVSKVLHNTRAGKHYTDHIGITEREHMSPVDCFDGATMRGQAKNADAEQGDEREEESDLLTIHPVIDGRLKDEGKR